MAALTGLRFSALLLAGIHAEISPQVSIGTSPEIFTYPQRSSRNSSATLPSARLAHMCENHSLVGSTDYAVFWLASGRHGFSERQDLGKLRAAGVRALQLHKCSVWRDLLRAFLDRAWTEGFTVVPQLPLFLFTKPAVGCFHTGFDCYDIVRAHSRDVLSTALTRDGEYHPAIEMILLARDFDVLVPSYCHGKHCGAKEALNAVLSAWDGWLDAETELGIQPGIAGIGATFENASAVKMDLAQDTEGLCHHLRSPHGCSDTQLLRALWKGAAATPGWAAAIHGAGRIRRGIEDETYVPHNDLKASITSRWVHTFPAEANSDNVVQVLREYYEFVSPPVVSGVGQAALLDFVEVGD